MKNLLLLLCFAFTTSFIFCQTPAPQNIRVHLKYYTQNCAPFSSINANKKSNVEESETLPYKSLLYMETGYNLLTNYNALCSVGKNTWHKTNRVVSAWRWLDGSVLGLGFRGGYSVATGINGKINVLDGQLSL